MPVVRKGAGRPAAAAKKRKHAQRTPLPEKKTAEAPAKKDQPAKQPRSSRWIAPRADVKTKAEDFADYARENGWWASDVEVDGAMVRVTCKRVNDDDEKEAIYVEWDNGRIRPGAVQYELVGVRRVTLRNVSAARLVIDGTQTVKREVKPRARRQTTRTALRATEDGKFERVEIDMTAKQEIIGANIIDKCYHLKVGTPGKGKAKGKLHARVGHVGAQQRDSLTRFFEADGFTVIVTECTVHGQPKEKKDDA